MHKKNRIITQKSRGVLLSDQVDAREISIILRELENVLSRSVVGDVVEFGCFVGTTSVFLAKRLKTTEKALFLYDSFEGLPPKSIEDESPAGYQFKAGELLATKKQLIHNLKQVHVPMPRIIKGWFHMLEKTDVPNKICFAFLDGDYYHSIMDPLNLIWDHLTPGAIIVVDDYANEALPGAAKAVDEWLRTHKGVLQVEHSLAIIHT
jgi:O-methyltransferase